MELIRLERDGGTFTACALCRNCMSADVHDIRLPDPEPPEYLGTVEKIMADGTVITADEQYSRWDERAYEIVRICVECGYEWGQR